jgi:hypothetical protein
MEINIPLPNKMVIYIVKQTWGNLIARVAIPKKRESLVNIFFLYVDKRELTMLQQFTKDGGSHKRLYLKHQIDRIGQQEERDDLYMPILILHVI